MKSRIALAVAALALATSPAALAVGKPEGTSHGNGHAKGHEATGEAGVNYTPGEEGPPGPKAPLPQKAKAYGVQCRGESKKHEKGKKGTAFSRCVTNMAQATVHKGMAPGQVCKGESRKRSEEERQARPRPKGTPFSRCVHDVVKLRHQERRKEREEAREEREREHEEGEGS